MAFKLGSRGQVVIRKEIRDELGIEEGFVSSQRVVGDHVEIHFFPPEHKRSLAGMLAGRTNVSVKSEDWERAREQGWEAVADEYRETERSK